MRDPSKLKILMFGWEFPPFFAGGLGVVCKHLTKALVNDGHEIIFALPTRLPYTDDYLTFVFGDDYEGISVVDKRNAITNSFNQNIYDRHVSSPYLQDIPGRYANELSLFSQIDLGFLDFLPIKDTYIEKGSLMEKVLKFGLAAAKIAEDYDFDIIHAHDWLTFTAGIVASRVSGKPLVTHIHNTIFDRGLGNASDLEKAIEWAGINLADHTIAVSEYTRKIAIEKYGRVPELSSTIYNCMNPSDIAPKEDIEDIMSILKRNGKSIVLSLGRITIQKGIPHLIEAAKKVVEKNPNIIFIIAGDGDQTNELIQNVARAGISRNVIFSGWVNPEKASRLFYMSDLFIMPSISEPFGLVPIEALHHDTPVIVSKSSGIAEILPNSMQVDFWDIDNMASYILGTIEDPKLMKELLDIGKSDIVNFTWDKAARELVHLFQKLLGK